jgi:hypothetical protein
MYKQNEKMLFLKKIPQLLANLTKVGFVVYALMFDCARGDVVRDPAAIPGGAGPVTVINNLFPGILGGGYPIGTPPPAGSFAAYVNASIAAPPAAAGAFVNLLPPAAPRWQMRGFAAFVTAAGVQRVYIANKRVYNPANPPAINNPAVGGHTLNYTHNMHTERQLAIAALSDAAGGALLANIHGAPAAPPLPHATQGQGVNGALLIPAAPPLAVVAGAAGLAGTLHIYTNGRTCQNNGVDTGGMPCTEYYRALANLFPNVTFHIYFPRRDFLIQLGNDNTKTLAARFQNFAARKDIGGFVNLKGRMNRELPDAEAALRLNNFVRHMPREVEDKYVNELLNYLFCYDHSRIKYHVI